MHILDYIEELPDTPQAEMIKYLHHFISSYPEVNAKVMFTTPFYTRKKWMIYVSKQKNEHIEVCFVQANQFKNHIELLDFKKRKQVGGITYAKVDDINEGILDMLIQEALEVDEKPRSKIRKKPARG